MSGKILRINIESYAGVKNKVIDWDEHAILAIIGDGGTGKSSIEGFVESCLTGVVPKEAINLVTGKASGSLDFERDGKKYTIKISKTKKSETVKIIQPNSMTGGKDALRAIVGPISINPFEVAEMKPADQVDWFKRLMKINTLTLETERNNIFDTRTAVNRNIKDLIGFLTQDGASDLDAGNKAEKYREPKDLELSALNEQMRVAADNNLKISLAEQEIINQEKLRNQYDTALKTLENENINDTEEIKKIQERIVARNLRIETGKGKVTESDNIITEKQAFLETITIVKIDKLQSDIDELNAYRTERGKFLVWMSKYDELQLKKEESATLKKQIAAKDDEIENYIAGKQAVIPGVKLYIPKEAVAEDDAPAVVEGEKKEPVGADDRYGIYYQEKPIAVLSTTEKVTFGFMMQEVVNPDSLPILLLDDFESVGSAGREQLVKMCEQKGWSALVTMVDPKQSDLKIVLKNNFEE